MSQKYILGRRAQTRYHALRYTLASGCLLVLLAVLQVSFFSRFRVLGAAPDLMIVAVLGIAYFSGPYAGAINGIAAGFLIEAIGSSGITLLPLCYLLCGYLVGYYARSNPKTYPTYLIYLGVTLLYRAVITVLYASLTYRDLRLPPVLLYSVLPELLLTAIAGLVIFFPMRLFCGWLARKR